MKKITIATRSSPLALAQVEIFVARLANLGYTRDHIEVLPLITQGDKDLSSPLFHKGGKGLFVREVENCLLEHKADFAVHSLKDLPIQSHQDLILGGFIGSDNHRDLLVSVDSELDIKPSQIIGTSSLRRACQLKLLYPDITIKSIRGSVQKRLSKNDGLQYHKIILAEAGLQRLNLHSSVNYRQLDIYSEMTPAFCQGVIGIQAHKNNLNGHKLLEQVSDSSSVTRQYWERKIAAMFGATCQSAFGVYVRQIELDKLEATVFCYKSRDQWARHTFSYKTQEQLNKELVSRFDYDKVDWSTCEETLL